jgi:hypothetical protein
MSDNQVIVVKDQAQPNKVSIDTVSIRTIKIEVGSPSNNVPTASTIVTVETKPTIRIGTVGIQGPRGPQGLQGPPGFEPGDDLVARQLELTEEATEANQAPTKGYVDTAINNLNTSVIYVQEALDSLDSFVQTSIQIYKQIVYLNEDLLIYEETPGILSIPFEGTTTLLEAKNIQCFVDGRFMNENSGWNVGILGLTFDVQIPIDLPLRSRYIEAGIEYTFLWSY